MHPKEDFTIILCISMVQTQGRIHIGSWDHYLNKLGLEPQGKPTAKPISSGDFYVYFTCKPITPWDHFEQI